MRCTTVWRVRYWRRAIRNFKMTIKQKQSLACMTHIVNRQFVEIINPAFMLQQTYYNYHYYYYYISLHTYNKLD
jgi:hypothetical protein